jgi:transposase-like protein
MMSNPTVGSGSRKTRRRLSPSEKYEIFVAVLTGQATQREAADRDFGVWRSLLDVPSNQLPRSDKHTDRVLLLNLG